MNKYCCCFILYIIFRCTDVSGQQVLPSITVKNLNEKIIISWLNNYKKPIQNIMIQRSYDSLKNYSTIGTVLNPQSSENGYPDINPPYNKMYYRLAITFEGGTYEIGTPSRPEKEITELENLDITAVPVLPKKEISLIEPQQKEITKPLISATEKKNNGIIIDTSSISNKTILPKKIIETIYPSNRIFTSKQNTVVIHLIEYNSKKYAIKFFDENEKLVLDLKKINDEYLYIEKYNFLHSGWFRFEIYENGELFEKNRVYIGKDKSKQNS